MERNFKGVELELDYPTPSCLGVWSPYDYVCLYTMLSPMFTNSKEIQKQVHEHEEMFDFFISALQEKYAENECSWLNYVVTDKLTTKENKKYFKIRVYDFECYDSAGYKKTKGELEQAKENLDKMCLNKLNILVGKDCLLVEIE